MEMRSYIRDVLERVFASPEYQGEITREQYGLLSYAYLADAGLSEILGQNGEALLSSWKAVAFGRLSEDQAAIGLSLTFLAESAGLTGDAELAYKSGEEGVAIAREFGQPWDLGMTLSSTAAYALIPLGNFERAREYINEAEKYFSVIHDPWGKAAISMVNGSLAFHDGNYAKAQACFEQSLSGYEKVGDPYFSNISRSGLADVARLQCQFDQSIPLYLDTIETWQMLGNQGAVARCIESIAFIFVERAIGSTGEAKEAFLGRAKSLLEAANRLRIKNHAEMNPIEQDEFNKVMAQLQEMTGEDFPGILTQGNAQEPIADPDVQSVIKSLRNT